MNPFKKLKRKFHHESCHHEWTRSSEEHAVFDDGVGEHTSMFTKWTCIKCGKVLWGNPNK